MATRKVMPALLLAVLAAMLLLVGGCGVKSYPVPSDKLVPAEVSNLQARPLPEGIRVSFRLPRPSIPDRQITEVRVYYGYLPLTEISPCPPCPVRLRKYHSFDLLAEGEEYMKGGTFIFVDKQAPMGKEAVYEVQVIDRSGRKSAKTSQYRVPRVQPAAPPEGLAPMPGDSVVLVRWKGDTIKPPKETDQPPLERVAGYLVYRRTAAQNGNPAGKEEQLNSRPLSEPELLDKTVKNGVLYDYQVALATEVKGFLVPGRPSPWQSAKPVDATPPAAPGDLMAGFTPDGVYLRFAPSTSADMAGYLVFRQVGDGPFAQLNKEPVAQNTYVDREVKPGQLYRYYVVTVDQNQNQSGKSAVVEVTPQP